MQSDKSKGHSGSEKIKVNRIEKLNRMYGTYYVELEFQKFGIIYNTGYVCSFELRPVSDEQLNFLFNKFF